MLHTPVCSSHSLYHMVYFCIKYYIYFRLILIAEKDKVYDEFPTPLINRLEKHFVVTSTVLNIVQKELLMELEAWAREYACIRLVSIPLYLYICILAVLMPRDFKVGDAFVGYQEDTPAAVVFHVSHLLKDNESDDVKRWKMKVAFVT